ncbi:MaoC family dehydratase [Solimonas fluminis]|uniref:MaoC family dehydratase n=1 Tax=Solimonas fluminis TaxID=2086571 RepID=A0A2S5TB48_9GAMM|nr:MaoC family dehydratase [Solimonas fluminis]
MIDRRWIGHELPPYEVALERGRLRAFAAAIGETDPVYTDVGAARAAGFRDLPAPPTFLFGAGLEAGSLMQVLGEMGVPLSKLLHAAQGFTYHRAVCAGDVVAVRSWISDIYDRKAGALQFVVESTEVRDSSGQLAAELRATLVCRNQPPA